MALCRKRKDCYLVLTEEKGKERKKIFIPEGHEAGGCWKIIKSVFALADQSLINQEKKKDKEVVGGETLLE